MKNMTNKELWKKQGKKIIDRKNGLYLLKWDNDETYLIVGEDGYEHMELRMSLCDDAKAHKIFKIITEE